MKTLLERHSLRKKWCAKPEKRKSIWDVAKEYVTLAIAAAAFIVSAFTLYIGHYGGPQNFRVTVALPFVENVATDFDIKRGKSATTHEQVVTDEKPRSFRLTVKDVIVFINTGTSPVLVSSVSIVFPGVKNSPCTTHDRNSLYDETLPWVNSSFIVKEGELIEKRIEFAPYRTLSPVGYYYCIRIEVVDRSGNDQTIAFSGFDIYSSYDARVPKDGTYTVNSRVSFSDDNLETVKSESHIVLKSLF